MRYQKITTLPALGLLCVVHLAAQTNEPNGPAPPATTFGSTVLSYPLSGVDHVDYFNGSLSIGIPLASVTGRSDTPQNITLPVQNTWTVDQGTQAPVPSTIDPENYYNPAGFVNVVYSYDGSGSCAPALTWVNWTASYASENLADEKYNGQPQQVGSSGCPGVDRGALTARVETPHFSPHR